MRGRGIADFGLPIADGLTSDVRCPTSFCVRLMLVEAGADHNIARYDTVHGVAHRDLINRRGQTVQKVWFPDQPFEAVLNYALDDFKLHYTRYEGTWKQTD
jgi:hypothetical protein